MTREPRLVAHDKTFRSGYGPRTIRLSHDRETLFVGCKDGSVTGIDLKKAVDEKIPNSDFSLRAAGTTGIRSLCDLGNGWLLLGQDDGSLTTLPWREEIRDQKPVELRPAREEWGAIGYVGRWDDRVFLVSPRRASPFLLRLEDPEGNRLITDEPLGQNLCAMQALSGYARFAAERWIVGKTGSLWWYGEKGGTLEAQDHLWKKFGIERPGFVFDIAVVRVNPNRSMDHGLYLSTDEGVFLLRHPFSGSTEKFEIEPVYLPGITDTCMAITHAVQGDHCFLWVSDIEGSVHLFWSDVKFWEDTRRRSVWKRSGLLERRFPVVRALASWSHSTPDEAVIGQACRDDRVVVSWYLAHDSEKTERVPPERRKPNAELLSWGPLEELRGKGQRDGWTCEALIADQIEETGLDPRGLRRFLRNPGSGLAREALTEIGEDAERAAQALTLWTHTLIGALHRSRPNPDVQDYLGIVRWLRRIGRPEGDPLQCQIDANIQYVRKWGIFGRTYADRENVCSALEPLRNQSSQERQFDALVYESLLFSRRVDLVEALDHQGSPLPDHREAFPPWDLRYLRLTKGDQEKKQVEVEYIAVSRLDGCAVYHRVQGSGAWRALPNGSGQERLASGRILLGTCDDGSGPRAFLLSCPVRRQEGGIRQETQIQIDFLEGEGESGTPLPVRDLFSDPPPTPEAVFSLHALGDGRVVVGLEGTSGVPRVGLLRVTPSGVLEPLQQTAPDLPLNYPELKTFLRNPVGALTSYKHAAGHHVLLVGCGDGQILKMNIVSDRIEPRAIPIGRLGAPVSALACRPDEKSTDHLRVFAGGTDGTVVAYQSLPRAKQETYATLWGFQIDGPLRSLHVHEHSLVAGEGAPGEAGDRNLVLAVTQPGKALLILDWPKAETFESGSPQKRLHFPGERLREFDLGSAAFSSVLLPANSENPTELARLLVAPAARAPRLLALHHFRSTPEGEKTIEDLRERWLSTMRGSEELIQGHLLRQTETTHAAAPELPAGMVRWILPHVPKMDSWLKRSQSQGPGRYPAEQWLPRHLRPLVDLDTAWSKGEPLDGILKNALLAARQVENKILFQEIVEAALSRANHQLFMEAGDAKGIFATQFLALLADLENVRGAWEGKSESLDLRMRIAMVRGLLDGDTLWRLSQAEGRPARMALEGIIRLVDLALGKGDLLLALETLRAINVALLRLCQRLERDEDQDWSLEKGNHLVPWEALRGFFQAIGDFAARIAHPKGALGEVVAHEISRAYALGVIACPPAAAELAMWLAEADLPSDTSSQVVSQLDLLEVILKPGLPLSKNLRTLLLIGFGLGEEGSYYERSLFIRPGRTLEITERRIGSGNVRTLEEREPFDQIIVWLHGLARQLADDAGAVPLKQHESLFQKISQPTSCEKDQLRHSRSFWAGALKSLAAKCQKFPALFATTEEEKMEGNGNGFSPLPVRPELVLFSSTLHDWCRQSRSELRNLRGEYRIFEPASLLYDEALALVERAAERFRQGAAVQKNLVLGVLGHGLLELLDEHLLEVWEIAQALAPRLAWEQRSLEEGTAHLQKEMPTSTAERFADYLLQRAFKAEGIPKNLRSLQGLLSFTDPVNEPALTLERLLKEYEESWEVGPGEILRAELDRRTYHFLHLTLNELLQNHRLHGLRENRPKVFCVDREKALCFDFPYEAKDDAVRRTGDLARHHLQIMMPPRDEPSVPSHGTGLYLANLAAGAVGWKLDARPGPAGILRFYLIRRDAEVS